MLRSRFKEQFIILDSVKSDFIIFFLYIYDLYKVYNIFSDHFSHKSHNLILNLYNAVNNSSTDYRVMLE